MILPSSEVEAISIGVIVGNIRVSLPSVLLHKHHRRMQQLGFLLFCSALTVGVGSPIVSMYLGFLSAAALAGLFVSVDVLLRARAGLRREGDLNIGVDDGRITAQHIGSEPHILNQKILGAQAFRDHIQIVAGELGKKLYQLELPLLGDEREVFLKQLREQHRIEAPERRSVGAHLTLAFTIVPAIVMLAWVAYRVIVYVALGGVVTALRTIGPDLGIWAFFGLALLSAFVHTVRLVRRSAPQP